MAKTFEDSSQGRRSYTQYSQTERRTSGVYGDTTKNRGESLKAKFSGSGDKAPIGSTSGAVAGSRGPIGSASGAVVGSKTSPRAEKEQSFDSGPTKKYKKFTDDDVAEAEKRVKNAEAKDGKYSDDAMQAARVVRTKKGQRPDKAAGGKSFGSTGGNSAETAKLDDYITLMAKGNSGKDNPAPKEEPKAPAAAKSQGGTSSSGSPRSSVTSNVRSTPSRSSGGTPRRESPVKGAGSAAPSKGVSGGQVSASSVPSRASRARMKDSFRDSLIREDAANRANAKPSPSSGAPTVQGGRAGSDPGHPKGIIGDRNAQIGAKQPHPMQYEEAYAGNAYGGAGLVDDLARGAAAGLRSVRGTTGQRASTPPRPPAQPRLSGNTTRTPQLPASTNPLTPYKPPSNPPPTQFERRMASRAASEARARESRNQLRNQQQVAERSPSGARPNSRERAASAQRLEESLRKLRERQTEEIRRQGW